MAGVVRRVQEGPRRVVVSAVVVFAAAAAAGAAAATAGAAGQPAAVQQAVPQGAAVQAARAQTARIARTQLQGTRAVLTATRTRADTATVRLTVLRRAADGWRSLGTEVVGDRRGWFWNVVTAPAAVCEFAVADTPARSVDVRLLVSSSIGCSLATWHFHVESGDLVPG